MNCVSSRLRLPNKGIGGCFGGPRAPDICAWDAGRRAPPDGVPVAACDLSCRARACRSAFRRRYAACDRRGRLRRPSTRRPAIVAINVRSAASPLRRSRLLRLTYPPCPSGSRPTRTRFAPRPTGPFFPLIAPSQIGPGPLPSQSDGYLARARPLAPRPHSFRLEKSSCEPLKFV
jgi:hypothetical protein